MSFDACPALVQDFSALGDWPTWDVGQLLSRKRKSVRRTQAEDAATAHAGVAFTDDVVRNLELRGLIAGIVSKLAHSGEVTSSSASAACKFLDELPVDAPLPKVNAEGDGGVLFAWGSPNTGRNLVIVEDWCFHVVLNAGTNNAVYFENLPFGGAVPAEVFQAIAA